MPFPGRWGVARVLRDTTLLHSRFGFGRSALLGPRHGHRELPPLLLLFLLLREGGGGGGSVMQVTKGGAVGSIPL